MVHNYKECDQTTEQTSELKSERWDGTRRIKQETKKSKWYHTTKKASRSKSLPRNSTQQILAFSHPWSSCSSSHSISPSPLSHTSSGNSSPHGPPSPTSEAECIPDAIIMSSKDDQQGSSPVTKPKCSHHTTTEMSTPTFKDKSAQSF